VRYSKRSPHEDDEEHDEREVAPPGGAVCPDSRASKVRASRALFTRVRRRAAGRHSVIRGFRLRLDVRQAP